MWGEVARLVADSRIIPFDVTEYSVMIKKSVDVISSRYGDVMAEEGLQNNTGETQEAPSSRTHWNNVGLMLGHRLRCVAG